MSDPTTIPLADPPTLCEPCQARALEAGLSWKPGFYMCPVCDNLATAKAAVWRAAMAIAMNRRNVAAAASTAAQLKVIRDLLSAKLAGGEAEFWDLVEKELRK